jgi:IS1 family transposase
MWETRQEMRRETRLRMMWVMRLVEIQQVWILVLVEILKLGLCHIELGERGSYILLYDLWSFHPSLGF